MPTKMAAGAMKANRVNAVLVLNLFLRRWIAWGCGGAVTVFGPRTTMRSELMATMD
ncbi:hypothetical protein GCM10025779_25590 [Arthrobacter cryoconiti]